MDALVSGDLRTAVMRQRNMMRRDITRLSIRMIDDGEKKLTLTTASKRLMSADSHFTLPYGWKKCDI